MPMVGVQSSALKGPGKETQGQDTERLSVQEEKREDSEAGGVPEPVPEHEPYQKQGELGLTDCQLFPRQITLCLSRRSDPP